MQAFDTYIRDTTAKLNRKVEDLEDVRVLMAALKEVSFSSLLSLSVLVILSHSPAWQVRQCFQCDRTLQFVLALAMRQIDFPAYRLCLHMIWSGMPGCLQ